MLSSIFSDICSAFTITEVAADAPPAVEHEESLEVAEKGEEEEAEEEEEEDEEEPEDQLPRLTEGKFMNSLAGDYSLVSSGCLGSGGMIKLKLDMWN